MRDSPVGETGGERARRSIAGVESLLSKLGGAGAGDGVVSLSALRRALKMEGVPYCGSMVVLILPAVDTTQEGSQTRRLSCAVLYISAACRNSGGLGAAASVKAPRTSQL